VDAIERVRRDIEDMDLADEEKIAFRELYDWEKETIERCIEMGHDWDYCAGESKIYFECRTCGAWIPVAYYGDDP